MDSPTPEPAQTDKVEASPTQAFSNWPPIWLMIIVVLWTIFLPTVVVYKDQVYDLFARVTTPETFAYVLANIIGGHWPGDILLLYALFQLIRGRWKLALYSFSFVMVNFLIFGIIMASKPSFSLR